MNELKIGDPVILTQKNGDVITKRAALVFGIFHHFGELKGTDGEPLIDVITCNPKKNVLAGGPDWFAAIDRAVAVRHASHDDIANGKISEYYETMATSDDAAGAHPEGAEGSKGTKAK